MQLAYNSKSPDDDIVTARDLLVQKKRVTIRIAALEQDVRELVESTLGYNVKILSQIIHQACQSGGQVWECILWQDPNLSANKPVKVPTPNGRSGKHVGKKQQTKLERNIKDNTFPFTPIVTDIPEQYTNGPEFVVHLIQLLQTPQAQAGLTTFNVDFDSLVHYATNEDQYGFLAEHYMQQLLRRLLQSNSPNCAEVAHNEVPNTNPNMYRTHVGNGRFGVTFAKADQTFLEADLLYRILPNQYVLFDATIAKNKSVNAQKQLAQLQILSEFISAPVTRVDLHLRKNPKEYLRHFVLAQNLHRISLHCPIDFTALVAEIKAHVPV